MVLVSRAMHASFNAVATIPKPVVARSLATRWARDGAGALCRLPGVRRERQVRPARDSAGIIPGAGGTQRLPRLIGPARAKSQVYTGRFVDASEVQRIGLVDQVVPDGDVYEAATELAGQFRAGPAQALRAAKQAIDAGLGLDLDSGLEVSRRTI